MRILAARLPAAGFLPVRVALRDVRADDEVQDQIEQAIREATGSGPPGPTWCARRARPSLSSCSTASTKLLQTTGVHQNDFLVRVARFQEREAEQGRPVLAVVTSRTAVADRARYPPGTVALRLEPFQEEHIRLWIEQWNLTNAMNFQAMGLPPLTWAAVAPHRALAGQPLLLTMLALYQAAGNDLRGERRPSPGRGRPLRGAARLLRRREVWKDSRISDHEVEQRVEEELERLSLSPSRSSTGGASGCRRPSWTRTWRRSSGGRRHGTPGSARRSGRPKPPSGASSSCSARSRSGTAGPCRRTSSCTRRSGSTWRSGSPYGSCPGSWTTARSCRRAVSRSTTT
ncbi:hypothetical protein [Streptomyces alboflavus]|uniref:hypothetical protein n=1 Tax=Streptomyces alboflavus TaxID=67267 RepID=UPI0013314C23|nr:hypothetical protein [Streptomyces alboflavus]